MQDKYPILRTKGRVVLYSDNANGDYIKKLPANVEMVVSRVEKSKNSNSYYALVTIGAEASGWVSLHSSNLELVANCDMASNLELVADHDMDEHYIWH